MRELMKKIERNVVQIVSTYMAIKSAFDNQLMLIRDLKSPCVRMHTDFLFRFLSINLVTPQTMVIRTLIYFWPASQWANSHNSDELSEIFSYITFTDLFVPYLNVQCVYFWLDINSLFFKVININLEVEKF